MLLKITRFFFLSIFYTVIIRIINKFLFESNIFDNKKKSIFDDINVFLFKTNHQCEI
jgi:hypothetical protein